ncbi:zinc finger CCHC domain-containing protein 2-like [Centruroides sculpturatus]|uniref:zinc finger CCHC domain-containing protein 2-like n=1 Tax=Centruroides sculpturatus TaxID=218467 RepID=UPI000C6E3CB8|nr:zinc finger CCHC domain-containing protein 2-like [Centruroides sculpturatus]
MICKEEVCLWFKSLNGSKRIEVLCCFLNMLLPLEIRFIGNCIETLGRKDYHYLRESECNANDITYVSTLKDVKDRISRSKVVVTLALLYSSSRLCANALYRILIEVNLNELVPLLDENDVKEVMLMFTMAVNHPAFTHDQKSVLRKHLDDLEEMLTNTAKKVEYCENSLQIATSLPSVSKVHVNSFSSASLPAIPISTVATVSSHRTTGSQFQISTAQTRLRFSPNQAFISALELLEVCEKTYRIRVTWTTDEQIEIFKTHQDVCSFHNRLLQLFPPEAKALCPDKFIPELPNIPLENKKDIKDDLVTKMKEYFRQLIIHLPLHLLNSHYVVKFFQPSKETFQFNSCILPEHNKFHSFTIYNSNLNDSSIAPLKTKTSQNTTKDELISSNKIIPKDLRSKHDIPKNKSVSSSSSSLYESPPASETESHSESPKTPRVTGKSGNLNIKIHQKEQYKSEFQQCNGDLHSELLDENLENRDDDDDLTRLGLNHHSVEVLRKLFDFKCSIPSNGLTKHLPNKICNSNSNKVLLHQHSSVATDNYPQINSESSSSSEYSSPPPSPPNSCHIHYSSSDDNLYERGTFMTPKIYDCQLTNNNQKETQKNKNCQKRMENKNISGKTKKTTSILKGKEENTSNPVEEQKNVHIISTNMPSNHQLSRPNTLPLHCPYLPLNGDQDSFQQISIPLKNSDIQSHIPSNRSATTSMNHIVNSPENEIKSISSVNSNTSSVNSNQMSPNGVHMHEIAAATRSQQVPEGVTTQYTSFISPIVHTSQQLNCTSSSSSLSSSSSSSSSPPSCVNNVTVNSMCPSPSMSSLVPNTNVTNTITYGCMGYIPQIFPPPISFLHPHTASQHNGFISPTVPAPSQASNFMYPIQNILPDLTYTSYHMQTPAPTPHPSSSPPAGFITFPGNCTYVQGTLPPTNAHIKPLTCYNCGGVGHRGCDCKETQDDIIKSAGQFHLNFIPVSKAVEIH